MDRLKKWYQYLYAVICVLFPVLLWAQSSEQNNSIAFNDYFLDRTMRIDFFQTGNAVEDVFTIDKIYQEGMWAGNPKNILTAPNYGRFAVMVYDIASNQLIFWKGFDSLYGEYKTTTPALNGVKKTFHRSVLIPYPKKPVYLVFELRDKKNILHPILTQEINPSDVNIIKDSRNRMDMVYEALKNGDPHIKVDLVFLGEGYTVADWDTFKLDVDRFMNFLFETEPYKTNKNQFNIYGVMRPSSERSVDEPRQGIYRNTALNASFNALDLDRYLLTEDNRTVRNVASSVPYDVLVILANSTRYGGGGIYNDYCITTAHNSSSRKVFLHEFGHNFAGLADEYYASEVSYNEFYPKGTEPLEPNITALLDPANIKWKSELSPGISVPTEYGKDATETLQKQRSDILQEMRNESAKLRQSGASQDSIRKSEEKYRAKELEITQQMSKIRTDYSVLRDKVGAFEGAGYASKGLYRPMMDCLMFSNQGTVFCIVCQKAIELMIQYYSERN